MCVCVCVSYFLSLQITRALVAARALVQGLETGRNVVSEALKVRGDLNMDRAQGVKKTGTSWQEKPRAVPYLVLGSSVPEDIRKESQSQASPGRLT